MIDVFKFCVDIELTNKAIPINVFITIINEILIKEYL